MWWQAEHLPFFPRAFGKDMETKARGLYNTYNKVSFMRFVKKSFDERIDAPLLTPSRM